MAEDKTFGIEIPAELLESISGGTLDDATKNNLEALVRFYKSQGATLDQIYAQLSFISADAHGAEMVEYIKTIYESIA